MATVNKILKPRRGKKSTMAGTKASTVLAAGELFLEVPDTGVGKGKSKIKVGDGSTAYKSLPYALGDTSTDVITYSSNSSTSVAAALNNVASGKTLANMIAGLKQAVSLLNRSVTSLNDDCAQLNSNLSSMFIIKTDIKTAISANTTGADVPIPTISGYTPVALTNVRFSKSVISVCGWSIAHELGVFRIITSSVPVDQNIVVGALYVRTDSVDIV